MPELEVSNKTKNEMNLRSEEIRDIMSKSPMWVVKWGISTIFVIIVAGIMVSWFMRYPDIIKGQVSVTHVNPPVKVVSQAVGNLVNVYIEEGTMVKKGTPLAELENPLSAVSVDYIKDYIAKLEKQIIRGDNKLLLAEEHPGNLGDLQSVMNLLQSEIREYNMRKSYHVDERELAGLISQLANEQKMAAINDNVLKLAESDFNAAKTKFEADKSLFDKGVIARSDYIQAQYLYNQKQMQYEQAKQAAVQSKINLGTLENRVEQLRYASVSKDKSGYGNILGHVETIRSFLYGWRQKYTFVAPTDGKVSFLKHLSPGMHVNFDEPLFAIIKSDNEYIAHGYVPVVGAGKVKVGQKVGVLLDNFPYHEYGVVNGEVKYMADIPTDNMYRVEIALPQGLISTHGDTLRSSPEMLGQIEIVTEDKRVLQRIMHSILKVIESR